MPLTENFKNSLLAAICGKASFTNSIYAGLSKTDPAVSISEPDTTTHPSYHRATVCIYGGTKNYMGNASAGSISNTETIYFPEALTDWSADSTENEKFKWVVLFKAPTGSAATDIIGYAHIVDDMDQETGITISANKVPLIRATKFTLAFVEPSVE